MPFFRKRMTITIALLLSFLLSSCTNLSVPQPTSTYQQKPWYLRSQALKRINQWHAQGAFSIHQPNKTVIATYDWQQRDQNYHIRIQSSFNTYSINITGRPGMVMLWRSNKEHFTATTPERLMQEQLGWRLPISDLHYWILGLPAPGMDHREYDDYGHLSVLMQNGFTVKFFDYTTVGKVDLPQMLLMTNGHVELRIAIKHWHLS